MKNLIILNPYSCRGKTIELKNKIESEFKKLNLEYSLHISKSSEDIMDTTKRNLNNDYSNFIAVGGDGTIHYVANALVGTNKNLGVISSGSGNDTAKNLGLPEDVSQCCQIIKKGKIKKIDLGLINNKYYYLCVAGSGFDSQVNDLANNTKLPIKGPAIYTYSVYKTLITFQSKRFFIKYDNQERELHAMMVAVANLPSYGGGMKIAPKADPTDGMFDICIIKRMSKIHFIKTFPKVFEGNHLSDTHVEFFKASIFEMESEYKFSVFADGEYICKLPAKFKIIPKTLNFITDS